MSDWIFEIHRLWQSDFSRMYSNCFCSCSFEREIIKIGQSSHKMYSNKILNFQDSRTILNACKNLETYRMPLVHSYYANKQYPRQGFELRSPSIFNDDRPTVNKLAQRLEVFANGLGDLGSIPGRVIPKTLKMELDTSLLNTQHYKVRFKGKVEQSWEWSSALPYTLA